MKKKNPSTLIPSSSETIANDQDLLTQILIRIPPINLLKLKSISKQWLSLISSLKFSHFHCLHHQNNGFLTPTALFLCTGSYYSPIFKLPAHPLNPDTKVPIFDFILDPYFRILQSCNGLFLGHLYYKRPDGLMYFICNPTTRKLKMISLPDSQSGSLCAVNLAFDPVKSPYYKIICVRELSKTTKMFGLYIYSSKTDEWDSSWISFQSKEYIRFENCVFCNGILHWNNCDRKLLGFDLENKVLKEMPMLVLMFQAPEDSEDEYYRYFGESRGHLLLGVTYTPFCFKFNVFEMSADYSHWFLKYCLNFDDTLKVFPYLLRLYAAEPYHGFHVISVIRSEGEASKVVILLDGKPICYELKDGILLNVYELKQCPDVNRWPLKYTAPLVFQYFETLSCV